MTAKDWKVRLYDSYLSVGGARTRPPAGTSAESLFQSNKTFIEHSIRRFFPADKDALILDLACGAGSWIYFARHLGYANIRGCDVSPEQVALARELGIEGIETSEMRGYLSQVTGPFQMILLIDVLEHLEKQELFDLLDDVYRRLKPGGKILLHVPNANGLFGMNVRYNDLTHETAFTPGSMTQALTAVGFTAINCYEDVPLAHGLKGLARKAIWLGGTAFFRLLFTVETGRRGLLLSQNMTVTAVKET